MIRVDGVRLGAHSNKAGNFSAVSKQKNLQQNPKRTALKWSDIPNFNCNITFKGYEDDLKKNLDMKELGLIWVQEGGQYGITALNNVYNCNFHSSNFFNMTTNYKIEDFKDKYLVFARYRDTAKTSCMYEYCTNIKRDGYVYVDNDCNLTYVEDLDEFTKNYPRFPREGEVIGIGIPKIYPAPDWIQKPVDEGNFDKALDNYDLKGGTLDKGLEVTVLTLISKLVEEGRLDEALERFPDYKSWINKALVELNLYGLQVGNYKNEKPTEESAVEKLNALRAKNSEIEEENSRIRQEAIDSAKGFADYESKKKRHFLNTITLGAYETYNSYTRQQDQEKRLEEANKKIVDNSNKYNKELKKATQDKAKELKAMEQEELEYKELTQMREEVKSHLQREMLIPIDNEQRNLSAVIPNCVMLKGDNAYEMKKLIEWAGKSSNANYVAIPSLASKEDMLDELDEQLEEAEENYQKTGKRTVIFINGMDKLLKPASNSNSVIAHMKDIMGSCSEDFHTTIVFYTRDEEKLDPITIAPHRVEAKIEVPVNYGVIEFKEGE